MKRVILAGLLFVLGLNVAQSQSLDFKIGEAFSKGNAHYASIFTPVLTTENRIFFYAHPYHSDYIYEFDYTPKLIKIHDIKMPDGNYVTQPLSINGKIYFFRSETVKVGKESSLVVTFHPWSNGQFGKAIEMFRGEGLSSRFALFQSANKEYFGMQILIDRDKAESGEPNYYNLIVFDKNLEKVWEKTQFKIDGTIKHTNYFGLYKENNPGFNLASTTLGNDGTLIVPYLKKIKEGKDEYSIGNTLIISKNGEVISQGSWSFKGLMRYKASVVNLENISVYSRASLIDKGKGRYPGYHYWFQSKLNGEDIVKGDVEITDSVEAAGRTSTFDGFIDPIIVATPNYVYVILEEFQQSSSQYGPPYASTFHGDLMVFQHDIKTGKIVNQHYLPKTQKVTGTSWEYYYASFIALPFEDNLNIVYQSMGNVARNEPKDENYHTYQVTITPDGTVSKQKLFESKNSNTGLRVSTLTPLGNNQFYIIFEEKGSAKPCVITLK